METSGALFSKEKLVFVCVWTGLGDIELYKKNIESFHRFHPQIRIVIFTDSRTTEILSEANKKELNAVQNKLKENENIQFQDMASLPEFKENKMTNWMWEHVESFPHAFSSDAVRFFAIKYALQVLKADKVLFFESDVLCTDEISEQSQPLAHIVKTPPNEEDTELMDVMIVPKIFLPSIQQICDAFNNIATYVLEPQLAIPIILTEEGDTVESKSFTPILDSILDRKMDDQKRCTLFASLKISEDYFGSNYRGESIYTKIKYQEGKFFCEVNPKLLLSNNLEDAERLFIEWFSNTYTLQISSSLFETLLKNQVMLTKLPIEHAGKFTWKKTEYKYKNLLEENLEHQSKKSKTEEPEEKKSSFGV